ncbi:MAG TPA: hypothetical protein PKZ92_03225 [Candidatus Woesebacteria bacterium]|jgi:hypothetical protein|nr:hypothetical protein [Candidatus Shapirobacteria bacterium]HOR02246.1 hypothetical protein [Candidatus Woesebacteria bacterium]
MKKIKILVFLAAVLIGLRLVSTVKAESKLESLMVAGENVNTVGKLEGTSFQAGKNIKINAVIDGILFTAGENVSLGGESDYLFAAGRTVSLEGEVVKDAFMAGANVSLENVVLGRDVYLAGENVSLSGDFGRNVYVGGSVVSLDGNYKGDVVIEAGKIKILDGAKIAGKLKYNDTAEVELSDKAVIGNKETFKGGVVDDNKENIREVGFRSVLFRLINGLVLGWLMIWLMPYVFEKLVKKNKPLTFKLVTKRFFWGLLWLIGLPFIFGLSLITMVGMRTGLAIIFIYGLVISLSGILVGYLIGWKLNLVDRERVVDKYANFGIGYTILTLIRNIPGFGWVVSFLMVVVGVGLGFNLMIDRRKRMTSVIKSEK